MAITHEVFFKNYLKVNQIVYSLLPDYPSSVKALAPTVSETFEVKMAKITKDHNAWSSFQNVLKS